MKTYKYLTTPSPLLRKDGIKALGNFVRENGDFPLSGEDLNKQCLFVTNKFRRMIWKKCICQKMASKNQKKS
jgi:hypothetical protein